MPNRLLLACLLALPLPALAQSPTSEPHLEAAGTLGDAAAAKAKDRVARRAAKAEKAERQRAAGEAMREMAAAAPTTSRDNIDALIALHARAHKLPEKFVHAVIKRESNYNPRAIGRGGVYGLMQIKHGTARGVGYSGSAAGLLDPKTNLAYGVAYLAGAYKTAGGDEAQAYRYFNRGYYYAAKRRGVASEFAALDDAPTAPVAGGGLTGAIDRVFGRRTAPSAATVTASADFEAPVVATAVSAPAPVAVQVAALSPAPALRGTMAAVEPAVAATVIDEATFKAIKTEAEMAAVLASLSTLPLPPRRPAALRLAARKVTVVPKTALAIEAKPEAAVTASQ